jgi:hypothetical protein
LVEQHSGARSVGMKRFVLLMGLVTVASLVMLLMRKNHKSDSTTEEDYLGV